MLDRTKFGQSTLGKNADVLVAKQVDYSNTGASSISDFPTFVSSAAEGEFAFFNADTLALISGATSGSPAAVTAVGATVNIFGALKRDGAIEKTPVFNLTGYTAKRLPYAAAVAQASKVVLTGTPVVGNSYTIKILETTPGYQQFPEWSYTYVPVSGDTASTVATALAALINDQTNVINKNTDPVLASASVSTSTLTLTAANAGATFRIAFSTDIINDLAASAVYSGSGTANAFYGNGTYNQVKWLEFYSDTFKGVTTQFPMQGARPEDYGQPTAFAASGVQYSIYFISGYADEKSPTPSNRTFHKRNIILAIPSNGSANAEAEVKGILGL